MEIQDTESRGDGDEDADDPDERGRRFTLTDSNYDTASSFLQQQRGAPSQSYRESSKENEKSGSNRSGGGGGGGSGGGSVAGLSTAAQHYLKSLPDFSFMLIAPTVENGRE
jgi:hypothetical protein